MPPVSTLTALQLLNIFSAWLLSKTIIHIYTQWLWLLKHIWAKIITYLYQIGSAYQMTGMGIWFFLYKNHEDFYQQAFRKLSMHFEKIAGNSELTR